MSADEIRRLADECESVASSMEKYGGRGCGAKLRKASAALLDYAAMVERCEAMRFNMIPHKRDTEIVDYILKGATNERK